MSNINFAHPSVKKLKQIPPTITLDPNTGYVLVSKKTKVSIKSSKISNSSSLNKDVMIDKLQIVDPQNLYSDTSNFTANRISNSRVATPPNELPSVDQSGGICQTMPFLHMIQSQLDYPMDFNFLWNCASPLPNPKNLFGAVGDILLNTILFGKGSSYNRLTNILYGDGECISTQKICPEDVKVQEVGILGDSSNCNDPCNPSIRIKTFILPPPSTEQELRDRLNNLGPIPIGCRGLTTRKLLAMQILSFSSPRPKWEDIKNLDHDGLDAILEETTSSLDRATWTFAGHAVTITGTIDGQFIVKNSWAPSPDLIMSYDELKRDFLVYDTMFDLQARLNYCHLYPEVTKCQDISGSIECIKIQCLDKGYDKVKDPPSDNCECECDEVTAPVSSECLNIGMPVQKIYNPITKKCECPDTLFYRVYIGDYCCLKDKRLQWCEKLLCPKTNKFYVVARGEGGMTFKEAIDDFLPGVVVTDMKLVKDDEPLLTCPIEDFPSECSGVYNQYLKDRQVLADKWNIYIANDIKVL